jgi:SAM-dependent methyltransferase
MQRLPDTQIILLIEEYMNGSDHPDQVGYRNQVADREFADKNHLLGSLKRLAKFGDFHGKRILDIGCGFGWHAFTIALLDEANSVVGIDILPSMIEGMNESIATMRAKGVMFDLTAVCGDVCDTSLDLGLFDAIYSNEAIEHVHDLQRMFDRCLQLLKPGGKLYLMNDSNVLNTQTRDDTVAMWRERETSWDWVEKLKNWRPVEHGDAKPFAVMREEIVREANSGLNDNAVGIIVDNTAGLLKSEIQLLAKAYRHGIKFPVIDEYDRCRNPETGEYAERLLDPFKLAGMLQKSKFKTQVRHWFRRFPLNLTNGIQFRPVNKVLFDLKGFFLVVGQKPV